MNRAINILLLVVSFPTIAFCIFVGFDLPFEALRTSGAEMPYRFEIFVGLAALLLLLVARRSSRRWVGVGMTRKPERFVWCTEVGAERKKAVRLFLRIEIVVALIFALVTYTISSEAWVVSLVYGLLFLDQLLFAIIAPSWFRVGVTQKAVVVADREVRVLYFSGLRRVETHQQTIYFEYIEDLQLFFPTNCIPDGQFEGFKAALESQLDRDRVFFSEGFKALH